jgi:hypothetical protein
MDDRSRHGRRTRVRRGPGAGRRAPRAMAAALTGLALTGLASIATPHPAGAGGGDWLYPARDRYEPGQTVTMIGYGYAYADVDATWRQAPFYGHLLSESDLGTEEAPAGPATGAEEPGRSVSAPGRRVGRVTVEEVAPDPDGRALRVSIAFSLPGDLAPGAYWLDICNDPCTERLGWFRESELYVGIDPPDPVVRAWPLTDLAIRWLDDDALLFGPFGQPVTAADVRAGRIPAEPPLPAPAPEPEAAPVPTFEVAGAPTTAPRPSFDAARPASDDGSAALPAKGDTPAAEGDGGALALWLVGTVIVLAVGCAASRLRTEHRPRRGRIVIRSGDGAAIGDRDDRPTRVRL